MKKLKIYIDYPFSLGEQDRTLEIELEGNETEKEIEEMAKEAFQNEVNYGYEVVDE
ncbi:hypothetical protein ACFP65_08320 [Marinilactibacillus sp. GCM10026970]|uniref:hypothetical protein n=1 Tax=Marinilactibacillus sp. GCM10026970 TaxID=3252642 RepID=UPI00360BC5FB